MPNNIRAFIQRGTLVLLGFLLAEMWTRETSCEHDPPVQINDNLVVSSCDCFSETYLDARTKFRLAVSNNENVELYTFTVGEEYTLDIAVVTGTLPGTVIHTSGYHGVEGYAGSAIQIAWLQQRHDTENLPTVILVHAVNPYGMATFRRSNENNVDLNRNGLHPQEWPDALARDPNIGNYQDFDTIFFNPRRAPTTWDVYIQIYVVAAYCLLTRGLSTLKRAMVTGQYHFDKGIFYGGRELQPSLQILWDFFDKQVSKEETVTMINVHTGLGPSGLDTIITSGHSDISPQELSTVFSNSSIPSLTQSASDVTAGYGLTMGTAEDFFSRMFVKEKDWIVTQEFGTVPAMSVGYALILENMARQYLPQEEAMQWTSLTKRAFYKRTPKWRRDVLIRGLRVLQQAIQRVPSEK